MLTILVARPAGATEPIRTIDAFDRTFTFSCPQGFTLTERYLGREVIRRFGDGRQQTQVLLTSSFSNSVSGKVLSATVSYMYTYAGANVSMNGVTLRINKPGEGVVVINAGTLIFDSQTGAVTFSRGPSGDQPNLCNLLSA